MRKGSVTSLLCGLMLLAGVSSARAQQMVACSGPLFIECHSGGFVSLGGAFGTYDRMIERFLLPDNGGVRVYLSPYNDAWTPTTVTLFDVVSGTAHAGMWSFDAYAFPALASSQYELRITGLLNEPSQSFARSFGYVVGVDVVPAIPEPGTVTLTLGGLLIVGMFARRRQPVAALTVGPRILPSVAPPPSIAGGTI
jgi:hypothetical protein